MLNAGVFFPKVYSLKRNSCYLNIYTFFTEESFISCCLLFLTNRCHSIISLANQLFSTHAHLTDIVIAGDCVNTEKTIFVESEIG